MTLFLFWGAITVITYTYILFPALVVLRGLIRPHPYKLTELDPLPSVSVVIAAYNEVRGIEAKLNNILSLDYPRERLEVLIASDGSNDGTDNIVRQYKDRGVTLLSLQRVGKAKALNAAVSASTGEILVFSDANSMYAPNAIKALVQPFADSKVGGVAGNQKYLEGSNSGLTGDGERGYWRFDRRLKKSQSNAGNTISATGAIYAIRRELYQPLPDGVTDDFVTSTRVIAQGYRLVFAPDAVAYEPVAGSSGVEFNRKVRVITRGLRAVLVMHELLNPFRYGFYAFQLFSHKVLRRLVVLPLLVLFFVSPFLWEDGLLYQGATLAQVGFYSSAVVGIAFGGTRIGRFKIFSLPFFFCMVNAAALLALINVLRGYQIDRWEPQRQEIGEHRRVLPMTVKVPSKTVVHQDVNQQ